MNFPKLLNYLQGELDLTLTEEQISELQAKVSEDLKGTEWAKVFDQGYMCACANLVNGHGHDARVEDLLGANFLDEEGMRESGIEESDIQALLPVIKAVKK